MPHGAAAADELAGTVRLLFSLITLSRMTVQRSTGRDGDQNYNPIFPFKMRGSVNQLDKHSVNVSTRSGMPAARRGM